MNMFYSSLQDHGIPENPVDGRLYSSLQDHGIPINPLPGILYTYGYVNGEYVHFIPNPDPNYHPLFL